MNATEDRLRDILGEHSTDVRVSVTDLAVHAIARDQRNRRRELTAMAGAAALALAVAIPVALTLGGAPKSAPVPAGTSTTSLSTSLTTPPTTTPGESSQPSASGPAPATSSTTTAAVPYAELAHAWAGGDQLHIGGRTIQLEPGTVVRDFAVLDGGGAVLLSTMGTGHPAEVEILDASGRTVKQIWEGNGDVEFAVSPDGSRVLFSGGEELAVYDAAGEPLGRLPDARRARAIVGDVAYASGTRTGGGETLVWNVVTGETRELPRVITAVSPNGERAAARWMPPDAAEHLSCWALIDLTTPDGADAESHCSSEFFIPTAFSADGTRLLSEFELDGGGADLLSIRSSDTGALIFGGGTKPDWFLGDSLRLSPDGESVLVSTVTHVDEGLPYLDTVLQTCTLDGRCQTLQPEKRGAFTGLGYYVVAR